jgi:membrane protein implicated in regulation of membrane protease activity
LTEPAPLPHREPRPFAVHWLVDSAVVFLACILVALMFDLSFVSVILASLLVGLLVAPFTRRLEARALAQRRNQPPHGA